MAVLGGMPTTWPGGGQASRFLLHKTKRALQNNEKYKVPHLDHQTLSNQGVWPQTLQSLKLPLGKAGVRSQGQGCRDGRPGHEIQKVCSELPFSLQSDRLSSSKSAH